MHTYYFSYSFPLLFIIKYCIYFLVLYRRSLLFIYIIYSSLYSQFQTLNLSLPPSPSPFITISLFPAFVSLARFRLIQSVCKYLLNGNPKLPTSQAWFIKEDSVYKSATCVSDIQQVPMHSSFYCFFP